MPHVSSKDIDEMKPYRGSQMWGEDGAFTMPNVPGGMPVMIRAWHPIYGNVDVSVETAKDRDPKGIYAKADAISINSKKYVIMSLVLKSIRASAERFVKYFKAEG